MALLEIETKARLRDRAALLEKLAALGCALAEPKTQDDTVYVKRTGDVATYLGNDTFLRIRVQDGTRVLLTAKQPITHSADQLVKREHEVTTDSLEETQQLLGLLGFFPAVRTRKTRRTGHVAGYEVCLDDIEDLGSFIELEQMGDEADAPRIQAEMGEFLASLGVQPEDRVTRGYDVLMLESTKR